MRRHTVFSIAFLFCCMLLAAGSVHSESCGNGIVSPGEECDDGFDNSDTEPDACRTNCKNPRCRDGVVDSFEQCDDGNTLDCDGCSTLCFEEFCGDNFVQLCMGEECDDGVDNANEPNRCRENCTVPICGDGIVDSGERCDDGNAVPNDDCTNCGQSECGDAIVSLGEECDDGNADDGDGCTANCEERRRCGDATDDRSITSSDALRILQRGIGLDVDCPTWICDVDESGDVGASDALRVFRKSVELPVVLKCGAPSLARAPRAQQARGLSGP